MNDPEARLRAARLAPPSARLDNRMEEIFRQPPAVAQSPRRISSWWWFSALALVGATVLLFVLTRPAGRSVEPTLLPAVYQFEPQGLMRAWLLTPPSRRRPPPAMVVTFQ